MNIGPITVQCPRCHAYMNRITCVRCEESSFDFVCPNCGTLIELDDPHIEEGVIVYPFKNVVPPLDGRIDADPFTDCQLQFSESCPIAGDEGTIENLGLLCHLFSQLIDMVPSRISDAMILRAFVKAMKDNGETSLPAEMLDAFVQLSESYENR